MHSKKLISVAELEWCYVLPPIEVKLLQTPCVSFPHPTD